MKNKRTMTALRTGLFVALLGLVYNAAALELVPNVTATASSTRSDSGPASAIVNGDGLVGDAHDIIAANTWYSGTKMDVDVTTLKVDLNGMYNLKRIDVWNYNALSATWASRRGVKRANIYVSTTNPGTTAPGAGGPWVLVHENYFFQKAPGTAGYLPNTIVDMKGVKTRYVGIRILSIHGEDNGYPDQFPGLSELRFYYVTIGTMLSVR